MEKHALNFSLSDLIDPYRKRLQQSFYLLALIMFVLLITITETSNTLLIGISFTIFVLALVPSYLWVRGIVKGFPIAPVIALGEIFLFAIPILSYSSGITLYSDEEIARAGMLEILFLATFIFAWYKLSRRKRNIPPTMLCLPLDRLKGVTLDRLWMVSLAIAALYTVSFMAGWVDRFLFMLPPGVHGILRTIASTVGIASIFFLALSMGMGRLAPLSRIPFLFLLILYIMANGVSLLLSSIMAFVMAAVIGYSMGSGRIPWITLILFILVLQVLHVGKEPLRQRYWTQLGGTAIKVQPTQYLSFYGNWFAEGLRLREMRQDPELDDGPDILDRASIIQMILFAQARAPEYVDYLNGRTIMVIPPLLVPRIIWPDKPRTHEGQIMLNVHFGRQTIEETERTYISWGMLAEFYGNFGWIGAIIAGLLLGGVVGWVTGYTSNFPLGSFRSLVAAIFLISSATVSQIALSIWVTATFQALVAATLFSLIVMRRIPTSSIIPPREDDH
ncbi:MAG: hypothetical protein JJU11_02340 [Candidatus Sumerlaeia bacterium]|nr:hypothetical protein [Candidatus Sumerlaeia bacterium]